jgi:hypothetical protein
VTGHTVFGTGVLCREYFMIYRGPGFLACTPFSVSKLSRRHIERLRKSDNLLTGDGAKGAGVESNHTTTRKLWSSINHSILSGPAAMKATKQHLWPAPSNTVESIGTRRLLSTYQDTLRFLKCKPSRDFWYGRRLEKQNAQGTC